MSGEKRNESLHERLIKSGYEVKAIIPEQAIRKYGKSFLDSKRGDKVCIGNLVPEAFEGFDSIVAESYVWYVRKS
ncbi:hypothetical protein HYW76_05330 [Candidatus Pacearchaeota archaeon]|nr:hypothetical protein [Candidatus Pacearchaeota archaeon]